MDPRVKHEDDDNFVGANPCVCPMNYTAIGHFFDIINADKHAGLSLHYQLISISSYSPLFSPSSSCLTRGSIITKQNDHKKSPTPQRRQSLRKNPSLRRGQLLA